MPRVLRKPDRRVVAEATAQPLAFRTRWPAQVSGLLRLQTTAGNRAVAGVLTLQRRSAKGLAVAGRLKRVSSRWLELWRAKKSLTIRQFLQEMVGVLNRELATLRVPAVALAGQPSRAEGGFRHEEWQVALNLEISLRRPVGLDDKVSSLSVDDVATVANTLYHEGRHAEQAFLVARSRASRQPDPDRLAATLQIPTAIAKAAQLAGAPGRDDPGREQIEEWAAFKPSGRHFQYWKWNESMQVVTANFLKPVLSRTPTTVSQFAQAADDLNRKINLLSTRWAFPFERLHDLERQAAQGALAKLDADVLAQLRTITGAFNRLVVATDVFRTAAEVLRHVATVPDPLEEVVSFRLATATEKWIDVRVAQLELLIAQGDAYAAYPHEVDAAAAAAPVKPAMQSRARRAPAP